MLEYFTTLWFPLRGRIRKDQHSMVTRMSPVRETASHLDGEEIKADSSPSANYPSADSRLRTLHLISF